MNLKLLVIFIALALSMQGCANQDTGAGVVKTLGAAVGGVAGLAAAKALAAYDGKRLKLNAQEVRKRERGYMIAFGLAGAAVGSSLAGTAYAKLKEQGKKEREAALQAAVQQARPQRYGEPSDPSLKGTVSPGRKYADAASNRECIDIEDTLTDADSRDSIFVKMCRSPPAGNWQQVTG